MQKQKFSVRQRIRSFYYAGAGIGSFFRSEHNTRIHLAATILVVIAAWWLKVTEAESLALVIVTGLVWITEMINTALEKTMDLISREQHPGIKSVKDIAAGAVLLASVTALIVGLIIFIPKILWISKQTL